MGLRDSVTLARKPCTSGQGFYSYPNPAFDQPGFI